MTSESRQVARQIRLFLEDGKRERLIVALALLDNRDDEGTAMSEKVHRFGLTWDSQEERYCELIASRLAQGCLDFQEGA